MRTQMPNDTSFPRPSSPGASAEDTGRLARARSYARRLGVERALLAALVLIGLAFYLANAAHYESKPLRIEENEWPPMARAVYEHGIPLIHAGEDHRVTVSPDLKLYQADESGLWHPPLYMYTMAGFMAFAGPGAAESLRWIGVGGLLVCCLLLFLISRELFGRHWLRVASVASFLLLIHPYAVQGSLFLDIDTSIYAPTFLLFAWLLARYDARGADDPLSLAALAASFALILWVKLPTAFVVIPVGLLYWILRYGPWRGIARSLIVFGGGAAIFLATYGLYVTVTDQPFWYMFEFTLVKKGGQRLFWLEDRQFLENAIEWHVAWFTPALLLLTGAYGVVGVRRWWRERTVAPLDFIWMLGLSIFLAYAIVSPNGSVYQGKYAFPAIPLIVFAVAALAVQATKERPRWGAIAIALVAAIVAAALIPDLLTNQYFSLLSGSRRLAVVAGSGAAIWIAVRGVGRQSWVPAGALLVCAALFAAQSIHSYRANTSPLYPVPDTTDFVSGSSWVDRHLARQDLALVPKDMGFYVKGNIIEGETMWYLGSDGGDAEEAELLRREPRITLVGADSFFTPVLGPKSARVLETCFGQMQFGTVVVFRRTAACGGSA